MSTPHHAPIVPNPRAGRRSRSPLVAALDRDWARLRTSRRALRTARSWADQPPGRPLAAIVADIADLDELLTVTQRTANRTDDAVLLALVELSQRHDELAGRVVLQHLLPALISRSKRYRSFREHTDPLALVLPAAWLAIRSYDVERRRHHVASSLLSDAVFQAFRRPLRRRSSTEEVWAPAEFADTCTVDQPDTAVDEFVVVLREASAAGVDPYDIELLRELVRVGSPGVVAAQRNVTPRTVRNHRDRAVEHVRSAIAA